MSEKAKQPLKERYSKTVGWVILALVCVVALSWGLYILLYPPLNESISVAMLVIGGVGVILLLALTVVLVFWYHNPPAPGRMAYP